MWGEVEKEMSGPEETTRKLQGKYHLQMLHHTKTIFSSAAQANY